ncbi:MAG: multiheme c-type cytochrome [Myxococcota bacterium]
MKHTPPTPLARWAAVAALATLAGGCPDGDVRKDAIPERPRPTLRLVVATDLAGTLEPCGCTSRPLGGIDRLAAAVADVREAGVPTLTLHAGDLFFGPAPHAPGEETPAQELWKAETVAQVLARIGLDAATPGARDVGHGAPRFAALAEAVEAPVLASGVRLTLPGSGEDDEPRTRSLEGAWMRQVGDTKVGVVGVLWPDPAADWPEGFAGPSDPIAAAAKRAKGLRSDGADIVLALMHGSRRQARDLGRRLPVDFVIMGGLSEEEVIPPSGAGDGLLLHAGRQGQGVLTVDVWARGEGSWQDVGELGRKTDRERLEGRIAELKARIAAWKDDPSVSDDDVKAQKTRLAGMRDELEALTRPAALPSGNAIAARYRELPAEAPRAPAVTKVLEQFFRKVNAHNRRVYADAEPRPVPEDEAGFVGSEACASCHRPAHDWWKSTPHGRAYATLEERHKEFNLDCVSCHVTGYGEPGGSTVTHVDDLKNVGCESCHGPGGWHVDNPDEPLRFMRTEVPENVCVSCHNPEHSDLFQYEAYRNVLIMPGHGLPPKSKGE